MPPPLGLRMDSRSARLHSLGFRMSSEQAHPCTGDSGADWKSAVHMQRDSSQEKLRCISSRSPASLSGGGQVCWNWRRRQPQCCCSGHFSRPGCNAWKPLGNGNQHFFAPKGWTLNARNARSALTTCSKSVLQHQLFAARLGL